MEHPSGSPPGYGESLGDGESVGESLGDGDSVGGSLGDGDSVGGSLGDGDSVGGSLGEGGPLGGVLEAFGEGDSVAGGVSVGWGDDVSLTGDSGDSVAVDVGGIAVAVGDGDGMGGVDKGSVAGGASEPEFAGPLVGSVPITRSTTVSNRPVKACERAAGCSD